MTDLWVVVHEAPMPHGGTYHGVAYGPSPSRSGAEAQLGYCLAAAEDGRRGFDGEYYLARILKEES